MPNATGIITTAEMQHQHQGVHHVVADQLGDRALVGDRGAEVTGEQVAEPVEVARDQGLVEVELRGSSATRALSAVVVLAEDGADRVTERRGGDEDQDRDQPQREQRPARARRAIHDTHAAAPCRPFGGATSSKACATGASTAMGSGRDRDGLEVVVAQRLELAGLRVPATFAETRVDLVAEAPDDVAALVVLDLLGVLEERVALGLVDLALRPRRSGRRTSGSSPTCRSASRCRCRPWHPPTAACGQVVAGVPEVLGERVGEVVVAVERGSS